MPRNISLQYNQKHKPISRKLRSDMTDAELILWSRIRKKQILGVQFNRQKPLYQYIVDFYAHQCSLVIECDGSQHYEQEHQANDVERDKILSANGLLVVRFANNDILFNLDGVLEEIYHTVRGRLA